MFDNTIERSLGAPLTEVQGKWGWFIALGIGLLIAGVIAGLNLIVATLISVFYIAAMMVVGGGLQVIHAFTTKGWSRRLLYLMAGLFYAAAGVVAVYDPLLTAVGISLVLGVLLIAAGAVRIAAGLQRSSTEGRGWIVGSGVYTIIVGVIAIAAWPNIGLWLLGAILTVDLLFQGCGFVRLGLFLRSQQNAAFRTSLVTA